MYKSHPIFEDPPNSSNLKLWRFIDYTKFVSLLHKNSLFFCKASILPDSWEGLYPQKELNYFLDEHMNLSYPNPLNRSPENREQNANNWEKSFKEEKNKNFLSCWHYNETESAAMWNLYLKSNEGVAIQTTFEKFKECFNQGKENIYIGTVKYIDYEIDTFSTDKSFAFNFFRAFVHKRKPYSHENEYRAILSNYESSGLKKLPNNESGIYVPVDLNILIEKIIVAPDSEEWFIELVTEMLKVYKLNKEVVRSVIDNKPPKFIL